KEGPGDDYRQGLCFATRVDYTDEVSHSAVSERRDVALPWHCHVSFSTQLRFAIAIQSCIPLGFQRGAPGKTISNTMKQRSTKLSWLYCASQCSATNPVTEPGRATIGTPWTVCTRKATSPIPPARPNPS